MYMIARDVDAFIINIILYWIDSTCYHLFYYSKVQPTLIMALSETIVESLKEAEGHIRNALAFASRSERSSTVTVLSKILTQIDNLAYTDDLLDQLEDYKNNPKTSRGQWMEIDDSD